MKIVVLDGYTLNPGDLTWAPLRELGEFTVFPRTLADQILGRAADAAVILTNKTPLTAETIRQLPALCYIGVLATGYNVVDIEAARARGIPVTNVPLYGTRSVAQHAFALLLELTNLVGRHAVSVQTGDWSKSPDWSYSLGPILELADLRLGIVGAGRIGSAMAEIGTAFGMQTRCVSSRDGDDALHQLLAESDVISLHCPLTPKTKELIRRETLELCKPTAFLINTARGPLVREQDLADALNAGRLGGAALDVLGQEPPAADNPLLTARNCIITPHIAWATAAARGRLMATAVENVQAFVAGKPRNVVN